MPEVERRLAFRDGVSWYLEASREVPGWLSISRTSPFTKR